MRSKLLILIMLLSFVSLCYGQHSPLFPSVEKNWMVMQPNITYFMELNNSVFTQLNFSVNKNLSFVKITFQDMPDMPEQAKRVENLYEEGFVITTKNIEEKDIEKVFFSYKVRKKWLIDNNLNKSTLRLLRNDYSWNNGTYRSADWQNLTTIFLDEDDEFYYLESQSPGFSYFAITADNNSIFSNLVSNETELIVNLSQEKHNQTQIEVIYSNPINLSGDIKKDKETKNLITIVSISFFAIILIFSVVIILYYLSSKTFVKKYNKSYLHAIEEYVKNGVKNNISYADLNSLLIGSGWEKEVVDFVLYEIRRDGGKILKVLYGYIKEQKAIGKSNAEITQSLVDSGWPERVVAHALMEYKA